MTQSPRHSPRFHSSRACQWNMPRQPLHPSERLYRHRKVLPMEEQGFFALFAKKYFERIRP